MVPCEFAAVTVPVNKFRGDTVIPETNTDYILLKHLLQQKMALQEPKFEIIPTKLFQLKVPSFPDYYKASFKFYPLENFQSYVKHNNANNNSIILHKSMLISLVQTI